MIDVVPRGVCTHHRVEDGEELAHARGQRDFLRFAGGKEATIERAEHRVAARADKGRHEQRRAHGRATHGLTPRPWTRGSPAEFLGQALPDKYACVVWHVLAGEIHRAAAASDCTSGSTRRRRPSSPRTRIAWLAPVRDSSPAIRTSASTQTSNGSVFSGRATQILRGQLSKKRPKTTRRRLVLMEDAGGFLWSCSSR